MNRLFVIAVTVFALGMGVSYVNTNYESIKGAISESLQQERERAQERFETTSRLSLASVTDPEILFYAKDDPAARFEIIGNGREHIDTFLKHALANDPAWQMPAARILVFQTQAVWVTDIEVVSTDERNGLVTYAGKAMHGLSTTGDYQPRVGQRYRFNRGAIVDWAITHEGQVYGMHTLRFVSAHDPEMLEGVEVANLAPFAAPTSW